MSRFCYVVERVEWDEYLDLVGSLWEDHLICRVFLDHEDAKSFCERNSTMYNIPMRWIGERKYCGSTIEGNYRNGLTYYIHHLPLS